MQNSEGNVNLPRENLIKSGGGGDYHRRTLYPGGGSNTYIRFMSRKLHGIAQAMYRISFDNSLSVVAGLSILLAPGLHVIPIPIFFGVLLYLGIVSMYGLQMVDRFIMMFMPRKHHPDVGYVRKVRLFFEP